MPHIRWCVLLALWPASKTRTAVCGRLEIKSICSIFNYSICIYCCTYPEPVWHNLHTATDCCLFLLLHCVCPALCTSHYKRTNSPQAVAAVGEEVLTLLGVLPGHARRMLLRLPSLRAAAIPVDGGAAAAAANNPA